MNRVAELPSSIKRQSITWLRGRLWASEGLLSIGAVICCQISNPLPCLICSLFRGYCPRRKFNASHGCFVSLFTRTCVSVGCSARFSESWRHYELQFCGSLHLECTLVTHTVDAGYLCTSISFPLKKLYSIREAETKNRPLFVRNIHKH
jgi:hypothetical protein